MAVSSTVTVGTGATAITANRVRTRTITVQNGDAAAIFVGDAGVTTSGAKGGVSVAAAGVQVFQDVAGQLFAISAAGTAANAVKVIEGA